MNAAELLVKCLENEGVDYIFGLPGEENIDVMDGLLESRIRFVVTRHGEQRSCLATSFTLRLWYAVIHIRAKNSKRVI
jgi:acetolactate synthase I/II/III large subunit